MKLGNYTYLKYRSCVHNMLYLYIPSINICIYYILLFIVKQIKNKNQILYTINNR